MKIHKFHIDEISLFTFDPIAEDESTALKTARLADKISTSSLGMETIAIDTTDDYLKVLAPTELADCLLGIASSLGFAVNKNRPAPGLYGDVLHGHVELLCSQIESIFWLVTF